MAGSFSFVCALLYFANLFQERDGEHREREERGDRSLRNEIGGIETRKGEAEEDMYKGCCV